MGKKIGVKKHGAEIRRSEPGPHVQGANRVTANVHAKKRGFKNK